MQQRYERAHHRAVQNVVELFLLAETERNMPDTQLVSAPDQARVDYIWNRNGKVAYVGEFKRRHASHDQWPDYMISASKVHAIMRYASIGWIIILYTDGLYRIPIYRGMDIKTGRGGRTSQSRDEYDAAGETCAYFSTDKLKRFARWDDHWQWKAQHPMC